MADRFTYTMDGIEYYRNITGNFTGEFPYDLSNSYAIGYDKNGQIVEKWRDFYVNDSSNKPIEDYVASYLDEENLSINCPYGCNGIMFTIESYKNGSVTGTQTGFLNIGNIYYDFDMHFNFPIFSNEEDAVAYFNDPSNIENIKKAINYSEPKGENNATSDFLSEMLLLARRRIYMASHSNVKPEDTIYCKSNFNIGDTIYYYCENSELVTNPYAPNYGGETPVTMDFKAMVTEEDKNQTACMWLNEGYSNSGYILSYANVGGKGGTYYHFDIYGNLVALENESITGVVPYLYTGDTNTISTRCFYTNMPIFNSREEADKYINGELDIENAINYNKKYKNNKWILV